MNWTKSTLSKDRWWLAVAWVACAPRDGGGFLRHSSLSDVSGLNIPGWRLSVERPTSPNGLKRNNFALYLSLAFPIPPIIVPSSSNFRRSRPNRRRRKFGRKRFNSPRLKSLFGTIREVTVATQPSKWRHNLQLCLFWHKRGKFTDNH